MTAEHATWIAGNVDLSPLGQCAAVTLAMQEAFPSLRRARGHYHCPWWGKRAHWWLVDRGGAVVDPTRGQFPSDGNGEYAEWDEAAEEPIGRCMNCGGDCYASSGWGGSACSERCESALGACYGASA